MVIKLKTKHVIAALGIAAFFVGGVLSCKTVPSFSNMNTYTVVIDAGHGSPDGGAVGANGTQEKNINLDIALKLREIFENRGIRVVMTRTDDNSICSSDAETLHEMKVSDMKNRLDIINNSNADLFLSVHMNSFPNPKVGGLHVFYSRNHPEAAETAAAIQESIASLTGAKTHSVKTASDTLYLMKNPVPPAILVECGFISNPDEEKMLNDEEYRSKIAFSIANAVIRAKK